MGQQPSSLLDPNTPHYSPTPFPLAPRKPVPSALHQRQQQSVVSNVLALVALDTQDSPRTPQSLEEVYESKQSSSLSSSSSLADTATLSLLVPLPPPPPPPATTFSFMAQKPAAAALQQPNVSPAAPSSLSALASPAHKKPATPTPTPTPLSAAPASQRPLESSPNANVAALPKGLDAEDVDVFLIELPKMFGERANQFIDNGVTLDSAIALAITLYTRKLARTGIYESLDSEADQQRITESRDTIYKQIVDAGSQIIKSIAHAHDGKRIRTDMPQSIVASASPSAAASYHHHQTTPAAASPAPYAIMDMFSMGNSQAAPEQYTGGVDAYDSDD